MRGMGPPPCVTKTDAMASSLGNNNDKYTNLPLVLNMKKLKFLIIINFHPDLSYRNNRLEEEGSTDY